MEKDRNSNLLPISDELILNATHIKWIRKYNDCMHICMKSNGCNNLLIDNDTHKVCANSNSDLEMKTYKKLNNILLKTNPT
jgi:hypothetical protein